jgi:hypothetical protein
MAPATTTITGAAARSAAPSQVFFERGTPKPPPAGHVGDWRPSGLYENPTSAFPPVVLPTPKPKPDTFKAQSGGGGGGSAVKKATKKSATKATPSKRPADAAVGTASLKHAAASAVKRPKTAGASGSAGSSEGGDGGKSQRPKKKKKKKCGPNLEWREAVDSKGRTYFWHNETKKTVWVLPAG